jgi:hypothetical protein
MIIFLHPVRINRNFGEARFGLARLYCILYCLNAVHIFTAHFSTINSIIILPHLSLSLEVVFSHNVFKPNVCSHLPSVSTPISS